MLIIAFLPAGHSASVGLSADADVGEPLSEGDPLVRVRFQSYDNVMQYEHNQCLSFIRSFGAQA